MTIGRHWLRKQSILAIMNTRQFNRHIYFGLWGSERDQHMYELFQYRIVKNGFLRLLSFDKFNCFPANKCTQNRMI